MFAGCSWQHRGELHGERPAIWTSRELNLEDATDILVERAFVRQVLAADTTVENRGAIEGTLFAQTFNQGAVAYLNHYEGTRRCALAGRYDLEIERLWRVDRMAQTRWLKL